METTLTKGTERGERLISYGGSNELSHLGNAIIHRTILHFYQSAHSTAVFLLLQERGRRSYQMHEHWSTHLQSLGREESEQNV